MKAHPHALVDKGAVVGANSRVWAFSHVCAGAQIGDDCNLCDHTFFESGVKVGNRVTIKCGVYLWEGVVVEDDVHIGACVSFTNDLRPRSRNVSWKLLPTHLGQGCSVGANATLLPVRIGRWAMVAAGAVVTKDVPDHALVRGNPARQSGWVCRCGEKLNFHDVRCATCPCGLSYQKTNETRITEVIT